MYSYLDLLRDILNRGEEHEDRTGVNTLSLFGYQWRHHLPDGFPLLTTKRLPFRWIAEELFWFLSGSTDVRKLQEKGVDIWDDWKDEGGELGPIYGKQWREWEYLEPVDPRLFKSPPIPESKEVVLGLGINGALRNLGGIYEKLYPIWVDMLHRCYDNTHKNWGDYGGKGVHVHKRWFDFGNFVEDCQKLPNWRLKLDDWESYSLDKDYYCSNRYGPETCGWSTRREQALNTERIPAFIAHPPQGDPFIHRDVPRLCYAYGLDRSMVYRCLRGEVESYKGWRFEPFESPDGHTLRVRIIDQIQELVWGLKNNPDSRRHIVSAWNPFDVPAMALPPCHTLFQCKVHPKKGDGPRGLSLHLYARSSDSFLGLPFNIASYALLLSLLAKTCGYTPQDLIISFGDLHLYSNHLTQAQTQLQRIPRTLPKLTILQQREHLWDYVWEDLLLENYHPDTAIPAPVAV